MNTTLKDLLKGLKQLPSVDAVRREDNSYALKGDTLIAISLSKSELTELTLDEDAANLEHLYLSNNEHLKQVKMEQALPKLANFYLNNCALDTFGLPAGCTSLKQLYLQKNQLKEVVFEGDCPALELLDISNNKLAHFNLPEGFQSLKYWYASNNLIRTIDLATHLLVLNTIDLRNNKLRLVPEKIIAKILTAQDTLETIYLDNNAPKNIPKVFLGNRRTNCLSDARLWFQEITSQKTGINDTLKLMLLGNGNAGKSTLLTALKEGKCEKDHQSTNGIQIDLIPINDIQFNVWDFGGQEIFHGTHQLFISAEAIQLLLFDRKVQERIRKGQDKAPDRITKEEVIDHPLNYWYDTAKRISKDSQFFILQNKKDIDAVVDTNIRSYADDKAEFLHISAKTGERIRRLKNYLEEQAELLPDFQMVMPQSWMDVRQFFLDNFQKKEEDSVKLLTLQEFEEKCNDAKVSEHTRELLLRYLHHNGFLYQNDNLKNESGETVLIADQRWALTAIYKPLERGTDHYKEFLADKGKIKVRDLFLAFGKEYTKEHKWLFLRFMQSCGLCFQLNDKQEQQEKSVRDVYVFPEFLPRTSNQLVKSFWQKEPLDFYVLRYKLPYRNYSLIQSIITSLGRKTEIEHVWHDGIHIATPEGSFKIALTCEKGQHALELSIESTAMQEWLPSIFDAFNYRSIDKKQWTIQQGMTGTPQPFDIEKWKQDLKEKTNEQPSEVRSNMVKPDKLVDRLKEVDQTSSVSKTIYFSYAWGDEEETDHSREKIVDELYDALKHDDFKVRRDKMDLNYGGLISEFMEDIGEGEIIAVFLSDKYLRSEYCMWELAEIYRNSKRDEQAFVQRILPVRVESIALQKAAVLREYLTFWREHFTEYRQLIIDFPNLGKPQMEALNKIKTVNEQFAELVGYFQNMNAKTLKLLKANDFEIVKKAIIDKSNEIA